MIIIKYKGEVIDTKDIEITWIENNHHYSDLKRTGNIEDYGQSKYNEGFDEGYDEGCYQDS